MWLLELGVSAVNYFVLMNRAYGPTFDALPAHRIAMTTGIACIVAFDPLPVRWADLDSIRDCLVAGAFWLPLILAFEWDRKRRRPRPCSRDPRGPARRGAGTCGRLSCCRVDGRTRIVL